VATTTFGTADPRTQTKWSKKLFEYALLNMELTQGGLMGDGSDNVIQVANELTKGAGDKVVFKIRKPLTGAGVGDDGITSGYSEALSIMNFRVPVHERKHSVASSGPMSEKRTDTDIRGEARDALGDWLAEKMENDLVAALAGLYNESSAISTVNELKPSASRKYFGGQSISGSLAPARTYDASLGYPIAGSAWQPQCYLMGTRVISLIKRKAQLVAPKFRPVKIGGKKYFVMLLHPFQVKALRQETGATGWAQIQAAANVRGETNPLFSGAVGVWDGVILREYERVPTRLGAGSDGLAEGFLLNTGKTATTDPAHTGITIARALFLGMQAACLAWGKMPTWTEDLEDVRTKPIVALDCIYGASKTQFSLHTPPSTDTAQEDFAVWIVDTCVQPD